MLLGTDDSGRTAGEREGDGGVATVTCLGIVLICRRRPRHVPESSPPATAVDLTHPPTPSRPHPLR